MRLRTWLPFLFVLLCWPGHGAPARASEAPAAPELILEVRLGRHLLADAISAYQHHDEVYLPLGELARMLTIAIRTQPAQGKASGYILDEQRGCHLDLALQQVHHNGRPDALDPARVMVQSDDLYVASSLLALWLPVDLELDMASLSLQVRPRETLPLQARLERQGQRVGAAPKRTIDPGFARVPTPYRLATLPFIDQTLGVNWRSAEGASVAKAKAKAEAKAKPTSNYSAYLSADLLGMEAALYLRHGGGGAASGRAARLTLARHDPAGLLLGPLQASSLQLGSVSVPGVHNVALGSASGDGFTISNQALGQPSRFDSHSLRGDLPPGWDVQLYFNEALVGFAQSRPDGKYSFDDQPLMYGLNQFRLVFHGPLGQVRVERHSFLLERSALDPGQLVYGLATQRDQAGHQRSVAQLDLGLARQLTASGALVQMHHAGAQHHYLSLGLHGYWRALIVSASMARSGDGGMLAELAMKTRLAGLSLSASRARARDFSSDFYRPGADPVRIRDELRIDGTLPWEPLARLQVALQARREKLASGARELDLRARLSAYKFGTALSHDVRWRSIGAAVQAEGNVQLSRRLAGVRVNGHLRYDIKPDAALSALTLSADKNLGGGYLLGLGVRRSFLDAQTGLSASLNQRVGRFGMGIHADYAGRGSYSVGVQLFMALGHEPRRARWLADAAPMAATGAASVRVFVDQNQNGVMDGTDTPIQHAGFRINGANHRARTDQDGIVYLNRLPANQHVDIGIITATLEDPQWLSQRPGLRIVARPGRVSELEFAVNMTGEIDGTAVLHERGVGRGVGDLELELQAGDGTVVATTRSASDGYFVLAGVLPGQYTLRISPAQLERLGLRASGTQAVTVDSDGSFVYGKDFVVRAVEDDR
jgi:hypothetical protein